MVTTRVEIWEPTPEDVDVRAFEIGGEPRRAVDLGRWATIYGDPAELLATFQAVVNKLKVANLKEEISSAEAATPGPADAYLGDRSFLAAGAVFVPSDKVEHAMLVPSSTRPGDVVEIGQVGGPLIRLKVDQVSDSPGGQVVSGTIEETAPFADMPEAEQ